MKEGDKQQEELRDPWNSHSYQLSSVYPRKQHTERLLVSIRDQ